jgi:hypothetical protein
MCLFYFCSKLGSYLPDAELQVHLLPAKFRLR